MLNNKNTANSPENSAKGHNRPQPEPDVTVVTVCFNAENTILPTLQSVIAQKGVRKEYIIVDGASTDSTIDIVNKFHDEIDIIVSEPDNGIYDAMNKGTRLARGRYIVFMNAADRFASEDTLAKLIARAQKDATVVYGDVIKPAADGGEKNKKAEPPHNGHRMFFCHQSAMTERGALLAHPFDTNHRLSADFKLFKQLIKEGAVFQQVDFPVAKFDTGGISNVKRSDGLKDNLRVLRETDSFLTRLRLAPRLWIPMILCRLRGK